MLLGEEGMEIRQKRRDARITQVELALKTGICRSRLSLAECGYIKLRADELGSIDEAVEAEVKRRAIRISGVNAG
jgi:hypothetical protein